MKAAGLPFVLYFIAPAAWPTTPWRLHAVLPSACRRGRWRRRCTSSRSASPSFTLLGGVLYLAAVALLVWMMVRFAGRGGCSPA